jgi:hypothetical protein
MNQFGSHYSNSTPVAPVAVAPAAEPHNQPSVAIQIEEEKKEEKHHESQSLPKQSIFERHQFGPLEKLWASPFTQEHPEFSYYLFKNIIPMALGAICASGYYGTGNALYSYFKKIGVFSQATGPLWEYIWTISVTGANFFQIQKFAGDELIQLYPELFAAENKDLYLLYKQTAQTGRVSLESVKTALQVAIAIALQSSIAFLVQVMTDSWLDFALVLVGEFVLMLSAVNLISDTFKSLLGSAKSLFQAKVSSSQLSAFRKDLVYSTVEKFSERAQEAMKALYQTHLLPPPQESSKTYGSVKNNNSPHNDLTFAKILLFFQSMDKNKARLGADLIPMLFKPLLAESEEPPAPALLQNSINWFNPTSKHVSVRSSNENESESSFIYKVLRTLIFILTTLPMALVFPLNILNDQLDPQSPKLHPAVTATFSLSAVAISLLITHINKNNITTILKELKTIQDKGIFHWYANTVRPVTWAHNLWKQLLFLIFSLGLTFIASQSYSSILKGIVLSTGDLLNIKDENRQLLAKTLWAIISPSNLIFNLHFMSSALDSGKNLIDWLTSKWASPAQEAIIKFDAKFTQLLAYITMPFKHGTIFFPQQPAKPALAIQTLFALFDGLILSTKQPDQRKTMAKKCFSMSLDDLERVMVAAIQELHSNPELTLLKENLSRDGSLEKLKPLLRKFQVTLADADNEESLPFKLGDNNTKNRKRSSWSSLYRDSSATTAAEQAKIPHSSIWNCFRQRPESEQPILESSPPPSGSRFCGIM